MAVPHFDLYVPNSTYYIAYASWMNRSYIYRSVPQISPPPLCNLSLTPYRGGGGWAYTWDATFLSWLHPPSIEKCVAVLWMLASFLCCHSTTETLNLTVGVPTRGGHICETLWYILKCSSLVTDSKPLLQSRHSLAFRFKNVMMEQFSIHKYCDIDSSSFPDAAEVWFSLKNKTYRNNSCVTLEDIGEGGDALLCMTNLTACCRPPFTGESGSVLGNWFFPNGTSVSNDSNQWDFYKTRGQMVVYLNHRRGGEDGIYRCEIPDSTDVIQTIYIGVYTTSTSTGE